MILRWCMRLLVAGCFFLPGYLRADYPADPTADTPWPYSNESGAADVQSRFNAARADENNQLGTALPMLVLPAQSDWDVKSPGEKALWLINRERIDRQIPPLHGLEANVSQVAQDYARYLLDNDTFGHDADGQSPPVRLNNNPAIAACHDFLAVSENLAALWGQWTLPVERAVYMWMYADSGSGWGHRHAILWYPYNDNSGPAGMEGFMGIGLASGEHNGFSDADIIVMNVFDPCATWAYSQSTFELSVIISGPAGGSVQSTPAGIDCGQNCSYFFAPGQIVTLTAATDACTEFVGWSGGGCSGNQACVVTLQDHTAVTADFAALDADGDQIPDCSDPPDDPQDSGSTGGGDGQGSAGGGSSGGGCFIRNLR